MATNAIHHVTAIAGEARRNLHFYTQVLGLRLVKKTVNFDDPGTYHFYYGDEAGTPGSILTFFPWANAAPGRLGVGETQETLFRVPEGALGFWTQRLIEKGVPHETVARRFGESVLSFKDPDGMRLALVALPGIADEPAWSAEGIPADVAIRGFHSVSLLLKDHAPTAGILTNVFGFKEIGREDSVIRYAAPGDGLGQNILGHVVDIRAVGGFLGGRQGVGSVHHIAFRAAGDEEQARLVRKLQEEHAIRTTEQRDRNYFRSVYFREPGGVLFEIATDDPGFAVDEPKAHLGEALKLPAQYEPHRAAIEAALPDVA